MQVLSEQRLTCGCVYYQLLRTRLGWTAEHNRTNKPCLCAAYLQMLHQQPQHAAGASAVEKPSIGGLFVPTRLQQPNSEARTTCRIAGLQRIPTADDLGLVLPPFFRPAESAKPPQVGEQQQRQRQQQELGGCVGSC